MKLNKIFMALAAMAMVGCSSEDVSDFSANQAIDDAGMIQLGDNFVLAGVGEDDAVTRTHWEQSGKSLVNKFLPIYAEGTTPTGKVLGDVADLEAEAVGLCWLGTGAATAEVNTNYEFYHFGWLNKDAKKAEFECDELTNGSLYSEIGNTTKVELGVAGGLVAGTALNEANPATDFNTGVTPTAIPTKSQKGGKDNLDYNSGIYQTKNKAIFGGDYIVYYPFNKDFKDRGTIPAVATTTFDDVPAGADLDELVNPKLGKATFRYSRKVTIEGGDQAAKFKLDNLSTLVRLKLIAGDDGADALKVDQIVLYSAKKQLLKQANLAADKIVAGKEGVELYDKCDSALTITANKAGGIELNKNNNHPHSAWITVLPTTVEDLEVLLHTTIAGKGVWARVNKSGTTFEEGAAKLIEITVKAADFKSEFIAVDEPSLIKARNDARLNGGGTVTIIGDITLDGTTADVKTGVAPATKFQYDFYTDVKDTKITYTGDAIIVPEDVTLKAGTTIKSDVLVLGKTCCTGTYGGRLEINGGTLNNVTMEPTKAKVNNQTDYDNYNPMVTYNGAATIAAGKTFDVQAGTVEVNAAVAHKGNIKIAKDASLTVEAGGDLNFMGSTVVNDGTIVVKAAGNFDMTDKDGNATATDGERMTNNNKFIHNVDAEVGTAVQSMKQNGEYRCRVNDQIKLDDAFLQWTACSVIEMVNTGAKEYNLGTAKSIGYKHNGKFINIEVNSGALTKFVNEKDNNVIEIGDLTVIQGGLNVDYKKVDGTTTYRRTLKVHGDMTVKAATTLSNSKQIIITDEDANGENKGNLTVVGAGVTLKYTGAKANKDGLAVAKDIKVNGNVALFDAGDDDALDITCANFYLVDHAKAIFGNRTDGAAKNMTVSGTIDNPKDCIFEITAASGANVLGWVTCTTLKVGGTFPGSKPKVVN